MGGLSFARDRLKGWARRKKPPQAVTADKPKCRLCGLLDGLVGGKLSAARFLEAVGWLVAAGGAAVLALSIILQAMQQLSVLPAARKWLVAAAGNYTTESFVTAVALTAVLLFGLVVAAAGRFVRVHFPWYFADEND